MELWSLCSFMDTGLIEDLVFLGIGLSISPWILTSDQEEGEESVEMVHLSLNCLKGLERKLMSSIYFSARISHMALVRQKGC